jgi:hypothetical protein
VAKTLIKGPGMAYHTHLRPVLAALGDRRIAFRRLVTD